jgi:hypothetical protein
LKGFEKKRIMKIKSTFAKLMSLALLVATLTIYPASGSGPAIVNAAPSRTSTAQTEVPPTIDFVFGLVGIGRGQTARINAVFIAGLEERAEPIEVELMFQDQEGNVVASERQTLLPGHPTSFDTHGIIAINQERTNLIPRVSIKGVIAPETRNRIVPTVEVFDTATGKTQFALNNPRAIIAVL